MNDSASLRVTIWSKTMATAYLKNGKLYVGYMDATIGRQRCERAPKELGTDKDLGLKYAKKIEEKLRAQAEIIGKQAGPLTVRIWFSDWSKRRRNEGISSADDDERRIRIHVLQASPEFAEMPLDAVRRRHTKALLSRLKAKIGTEREKLGARTVRNIWGALSSMFEDAVDSEVISANPCKLKRGSLPKRSDKDATWRSTAIFTRREVEQIVIADRIPWDRRMFYAACFFAGGARFGEAAARRWRDYDPELRPDSDGEQVAFTTLLPAKAVKGCEGSERPPSVIREAAYLAILRTDDHREIAKDIIVGNIQVPSAPPVNLAKPFDFPHLRRWVLPNFRHGARCSGDGHRASR